MGATGQGRETDENKRLPGGPLKRPFHRTGCETFVSCLLLDRHWGGGKENRNERILQQSNRATAARP